MSTNERSRKKQTVTNVDTAGCKDATWQVRIGGDHCGDDSDTVPLKQLPETTVTTSKPSPGSDPYNTAKKPATWPSDK